MQWNTKWEKKNSIYEKEPNKSSTKQSNIHDKPIISARKESARKENTEEGEGEKLKETGHAHQQDRRIGDSTRGRHSIESDGFGKSRKCGQGFNFASQAIL